jgi:starch phosphorylase
VEGLGVSVDLAGVTVRASVWRASIDRISLYLLDTEVNGETSPDQLVADRLYSGGTEERIRQEILLGVGGFRALRALGIDADVYHLNEGHAGFLALERVRTHMEDHGLTFDEAVEAVRPGLLFTTHTPVSAGFDRFPRTLMERYFASWCEATGQTLDQLMELGREPGTAPAPARPPVAEGSEPDGQEEPPAQDELFNLAAMSLRLCGRANGVSRLHGAVSRKLFAELWPGLPTDEVPIASVTNGVHGRTWVGEEMDGLFDEVIGPDWQSAGPERWQALRQAPDERLWAVRNAARARLVAFARHRAKATALRRRGRESAWADTILDPAALTIGFARRFATYKRATLLLRDLDRFRRLVGDAERPVQLLFAGKAHPADEPGKEYLRAVASLADDPELRDRVVFVEDYDVDAGRMLTQGCDVWLNTPTRPMEACGTSGMKAALNGALNCSILDGWWDEWYEPELGWAIPSSDWIEDPEQRDAAEADWLYDVLEREVVPLFYERRDDGLPAAWVARVRSALITLGPKVSADRMVGEYVERFYEPAAARSRALAESDHARARALAAWRRRVADGWHELAVVAVHADEHDPALGDALEVSADVRIGALAPAELEVQVVHGPVDPAGELRTVTVAALERTGEADGLHRWRGVVPCDRAGAFGFAVRAVPSHPDLASWLDLGLVAWAPWPA